MQKAVEGAEMLREDTETQRCSPRFWLIKKRCDLGMSQKEAAERIGISQNYYCWLEQGKRTPSPQIAKKISKALGVCWVFFYRECE